MSPSLRNLRAVEKGYLFTKVIAIGVDLNRGQNPPKQFQIAQLSHQSRYFGVRVGVEDIRERADIVSASSAESECGLLRRDPAVRGIGPTRSCRLGQDLKLFYGSAS
jgi:hypothetical protein